MTETIKLSFTQDWNHKLGCDAFGTVRLDSEKYQPGRRYAVWLKDELLGTAECVAVYRLKLAEITDRLAYFDVGKPASYLRALLERMYAKQGITWEHQQLAHVLLVWIDRAKAGAVHAAATPAAPKPPPIGQQATLDLPGTFKPAERARGPFS